MAPGTVTFTATNALASDASFSVAGEYVLRLTANDSLLSGSDELTVTVNEPNLPPVADDLSLSLNEDDQLALSLTGSDPDGDTITFSLTSSPGFGSLSGTPPNFTYTPTNHYNGADSFTYIANDGQLGLSSCYRILDRATRKRSTNR